VRTLLLWDVDHTLLAVDGLSQDIYGEVFRQLIGSGPRRVAGMAGRTDRAIISETLRFHGITPTAALLAEFARLLAERFTARQREIKARGRALPGAHAALRALAGRAEVIQSLLTGNMLPIATCKLTAFGLHEHVDFEVGAYGGDHVDRPPLVDLARRRTLRKYGESFDAATTVLVGDTPHDVAAGRDGGARVLAVATGASDEAALRAAGAEIVLTDLRDTGAVVRAILPLITA
jgi:phosphoglycolate phosphatase-like HAD superfamily hydrolase